MIRQSSPLKTISPKSKKLGEWMRTRSFPSCKISPLKGVRSVTKSLPRHWPFSASRLSWWRVCYTTLTLAMCTTTVTCKFQESLCSCPASSAVSSSTCRSSPPCSRSLNESSTCTPIQSVSRQRPCLCYFVWWNSRSIYPSSWQTWHASYRWMMSCGSPCVSQPWQSYQISTLATMA